MAFLDQSATASPSDPPGKATLRRDTALSLPGRRNLYLATLIVQGLWSLVLAIGAAFAYLSTTVPGTDGASILPLTAWSVILAGLSVAAAISCWQTARKGPPSGSRWWIAAVVVGEILILLILTLPACATVHSYFSGALLVDR